MKIGIRNGSLRQELPEALETAGRIGFDGLEVTTQDTAQIRGWLEEGGPDGAAGVRALAQRAGCAVSSFSVAIFRRVNFGQPDEALRREGVALVCDALRACRNVGGVALLLPHFDRERLDIGEDEEARYVEALRECAPVALETGVAVALETSCSAAQLKRIVDAVDCPKVGIYQDLANAISYRQDPAATIRALGPAIVMVHVKDTHSPGQAPLGEGKVDWAACRAALRDVGYDGWYVLETPPGDDPVASATRYLDFTRRWLAA